jgi:hypothetical protein
MARCKACRYARPSGVVTKRDNLIRDCDAPPDQTKPDLSTLGRIHSFTCASRITWASMAVLASGLLGSLFAALVAVISAKYVIPKAQDRWDKIKKQRELDLIAVGEFHTFYGEFLALRKLWNAPLREGSKFQMSTKFAWDCLGRATAIEGGVESLLVKVAADRRLTEDQIDALGATRQAFQSLRRAIRDRQELKWTYDNEPHYVALKVLAAHMSGLLANSPGLESHPSSEEAAANLRSITSNEYEERSKSTKRWVDVGTRLAVTAERAVRV